MYYDYCGTKPIFGTVLHKLGSEIDSVCIDALLGQQKTIL